MGLIDDLWSRINQVQTVVNNVVTTVVSAGVSAVTGTTPGFGGSGGFGGGGAGGAEPVRIVTPSKVSIFQPGEQAVYVPLAESKPADIAPVSIVDVVKSVPQYLNVAQEGMFGGVEGKLQTIANAMIYNLNGRITELWQALTSLKDSIIEALQKAWDKTYQMIASTLDSAIGVINAGLQEILEVSRQVYFTIRQYLSGALGDLMAGLQDISATISRALKDIQRDMAIMLKAVDILDSPERFADLLMKSMVIMWTKEV